MDNYRAFYQKYKEKLFSYLMRMTGDYFLSSDILQESFTKFLEHYGADNNSASLLYTIARNSVLDNMRKKRRMEALDDQMIHSLEDQERLYMIREEYRQVMKCIEQLSRDEREIISLAADGGLNYRQIARIIGISENNVKVKIHRARLKLRDMLQAQTDSQKKDYTRKV